MQFIHSSCMLNPELEPIRSDHRVYRETSLLVVKHIPILKILWRGNILHARIISHHNIICQISVTVWVWHISPPQCTPAHWMPSLWVHLAWRTCIQQSYWEWGFFFFSRGRCKSLYGICLWILAPLPSDIFRFKINGRRHGGAVFSTVAS